MSYDSFFDILEASLPTKKKLELDWLPVGIDGLWVHRLSGSDLLTFLDAATLATKDQESTFKFAVELAAKTIGVEESAGFFDSDRGRAWLKAHPMKAMELFKASQDFNELTESSAERKND